MWDRVASTLNRTGPAASAPAAAPKPASASKLPSEPERPRLPRLTGLGTKVRDAPLTGVQLALDPMARADASTIRMDRKAYGRMRKGKLRPDARIDLHGMTAERAHRALNGFVLQSFSQGHRLLLVITGKGRAAGDPDAISPRKGILRHAVPDWLDQAPLNQIVLQIAPAHRSHGGSGAYYVYLRRA